MNFCILYNLFSIFFTQQDCHITANTTFLAYLLMKPFIDWPELNLVLNQNPWIEKTNKQTNKQSVKQQQQNSKTKQKRDTHITPYTVLNIVQNLYNPPLWMMDWGTWKLFITTMKKWLQASLSFMHAIL